MKIVGQENIMRDISINIQASRIKNTPMPHTIISGASGHGKTTIATYIATEMGGKFRVLIGSAITDSDDVEDIAFSITDKEVVFIDEIHALGKKSGVYESIYSILDDKELNGIELDDFTLIGATTDIAEIRTPLKNRFILQYRLTPYKQEQIEEILADIGCDKLIASEIAKRSRNVPRIAKNFYSRIQDEAIVSNSGIVTKDIVNSLFTRNGIDEMGLDETDRAILLLLFKRQAYQRRNAIGSNSISDQLNIKMDDLKLVYEPHLIRVGLMERTARGRILTAKGQEYIKQFRE